MTPGCYDNAPGGYGSRDFERCYIYPDDWPANRSGFPLSLQDSVETPLRIPQGNDTLKGYFYYIPQEPVSVGDAWTVFNDRDPSLHTAGRSPRPASASPLSQVPEERVRVQVEAQVGQRGAGDPTAKAHVVELRLLSPQAGFDIAQALPVGELRECHGQILVPAGEILRVAVSAVAGNAFVEFLVGQMLDQLRKHGAARVHPALWPLPPPPPSSISRFGISNRSRPQNHLSH